MIPIQAGQTMEWLDPQSAIPYRLRYLTGREVEIFSTLKTGENIRKEHIDAAMRQVDAKNKGRKKPLAKDERWNAIVEAAADLAKSEVGNDTGANVRYCRDLVDLMLAGWGGDAPKSFPDDGRPTDYLRYADIMTMAEVITERMEELTGLTVEELKN